MTSDQKLGAFLFYVGLFFALFILTTDDKVSIFIAAITAFNNISVGVFLMSAEEKKEGNDGYSL
ncbi:hypothetical protein [Pseudochrobactrum asaccharolyticum]|uniref:hypothetical protein n=1 Tax=Pseudochrobactrum asaccharolyticum TaxID=354351 RepID=UPI0040436748